MQFDDYIYVDLGDNTHVVRYDPTERLPMQVRTPLLCWYVPGSGGYIIRKLAEALYKANEEIERLEEELEDIARANAQ
jgi:hypothetical protein